jgi:hypothetical protein
MLELLEKIADQLGSDLKETMKKCFNLGVVDERKRVIESAKKIRGQFDNSPAMDQLISTLEKELKEMAK